MLPGWINWTRGGPAANSENLNLALSLAVAVARLTGSGA
jgi:hypothetical protein